MEHVPRSADELSVVVVGCRGQLARSLKIKGSVNNAKIHTFGRPQFDLAEANDIAGLLQSCAPDIVVNTAAYTSVDKAEEEPALALEINGHGAGQIAVAARELDVPLIHISTDYVFNGRKMMPYVEDDPVDPINSYGRSKLDGERRVREAMPNHIILRTAWVFSPFGTNFVKTMLRLAETRDEVGVVADQIGSPTSALDLADGILRLAREVVGQPLIERFGTYHMTGAGVASWADFAEVVFTASGRFGGPSAKVCRIASADFPTLATRPANSQLQNARLVDRFGIRLRDWRGAVEETVEQILAERPSKSALRV